jgi:hypothetical protein
MPEAIIPNEKKKEKSPDLEIVELKIQVYTNMDTQVVLTADLIDNKKVSGKYPFLCTNYEYSNSILKEKTQDEIFDIFFNRQKFYNFMLTSKLKKMRKAKKRYDSDIAKTNITQMLNALFPISFPIKDSVTIKSSENVNIIEMAKKMFQSNKYTYLKLNKSSTVTQVIWLDTISSNPVYYEIYKKNKDFYKKVFDYAENVPSTENIVKGEESDIAKINAIRIVVKDLYTTTVDQYNNTKKTIKLTKEESILHFLISNYRKNTKEYNDFIKTYVITFINSDSINRYTGNSQEQYEKQFYESVPEIKFYQTYMSEIVDLLPPKRISIDPTIAKALKLAKESNNFEEFIKIYSGENKGNYCDLIRLDDGKYEIHLGIAVVGGKVSNTNYKFFCNYNSHRLGNDLNYLIRDSDEEGEKIRLYGYIDLENAKDTTEYVGVVNSSVKRKDVQNEMKEERERGLERGWRGGKTRKNRKNNQRTLKLHKRDFKKK